MLYIFKLACKAHLRLKTGGKRDKNNHIFMNSYIFKQAQRMLEGADDDFDILEILDEFSDLSVGQAAKKVRELQFAREINEHRVGIFIL